MRAIVLVQIIALTKCELRIVQSSREQTLVHSFVSIQITSSEQRPFRSGWIYPQQVRNISQNRFMVFGDSEPDGLPLYYYSLLLVLGMCFFAGGTRYSEQGFLTTAAQLNGSLLTLSVVAVLIPGNADFAFVVD